MPEPGHNRQFSVHGRDFTKWISAMLASGVSDEHTEKSDVVVDSDVDPDWRDSEDEKQKHIQR